MLLVKATGLAHPVIQLRVQQAGQQKLTLRSPSVARGQEKSCFIQILAFECHIPVAPAVKFAGSLVYHVPRLLDPSFSLFVQKLFAEVGVHLLPVVFPSALVLEELLQCSVANVSESHSCHYSHFHLVCCSSLHHRNFHRKHLPAQIKCVMSPKFTHSTVR